MQTNTQTPPQKIYLKDYKAPDFEIKSIDLYFNLLEERTEVRSTLKISKIGSHNADLVLDGEELTLKEISLNGHTPTAQELSTDATSLRLKNLPGEFTLETVVEINPKANTSLSGLYYSGGNFTTQCEAQGFRRITYFMDRPDVMTTYTVTIEADKKKYPVLLSNGDCLKKEDKGERHTATWKDPWKKPSYLFALVAGDLGVIKDTFTTMSGKKVNLEIYSPHGTQNKCVHAMNSLKKSMKWDEERFGREYDLSIYMIVAMDDFNAGAMENKGLNIFNSRLVYADSATATDADYYNIESVIAHEYFHNWTGNRVTVRDWFHLSIKEGLTVFRDQEFSMDQASRGMVRVDNVNDLRSSQFLEDAGPNSHPIRPEFCYAVDNFYTSTIYEKGAEVIRMMQTMVGRPGFRKGMDNYFKKYDGFAVVAEDFISSIAEANNQDWEQFKAWYSNSGTPTVKVEEKFSGVEQKYTLTLTQSGKTVFHIPLVIGLIDEKGREMNFSCAAVQTNTENQKLIHLKKQSETFVFENVDKKPILSLNRQFSAPINLEWNASQSDLLQLMKYDTDSFNRWEAAQKIYADLFLNDGNPEKVIEALKIILNDEKLDSDMKAALMALPSDEYLFQKVSVFSSDKFLQSREKIEKTLFQGLEAELLNIYQKYHGKNEQSLDPKHFGDRRLKNLCLSYLANGEKHWDLLQKQFQSKLMTDQQAAFSIMVDLESPLRDQAIEGFHKNWKDNSVVLNKWFVTQAMSRHPKTYETVQKLWTHPDFNKLNPNRVYALLWRFGDNLVRFHDVKSDSYTFVADKILELDKINPQVAARVAGVFDVWKKLEEGQKKKAHVELERMLKHGLSKNTHEIVSKQLE